MLKTIGLPDKPVLSKNDSNKSVSSKNNNQRPIFGRNNSNSKTDKIVDKWYRVY